ncbi:putative mrna splicing factor atp-dependent rna helicase [Operophtera brumata]|uniref:RNA helicase n=1 Tax=Operophtera brumata TaxID=104452 RepID=A0A0L7KXL8_OPEBR|nr:putative mrna splicing factor atp-dependent rna helicase [Operophtera brumata]
MDSKYAVVGVANGMKKVNLKRKKNDIVNIHVKRLKLTSTQATTVLQAETNGAVSQTIEKYVKESSENLLETRQQLPVYMVKGSGKTTQIPQLIHEQRLEGSGTIAVTQPRRVAAITIALRVANEMNCEIGTIVGYSVRFEDVTSQRTKVKYLTDGMLLREAIVDPLLKRYSIIILDEAHERTVSTDVLFGIVKLAQKERNEKKLNPLKIIIMSATMDVDSFRNYFDNCQVVYLEGRAHPVTIYHSKMKQEDYQYAAVCTIFQLHATTPADHDFLVFLTGQEEIETLQVWRDAPPGTRKIILSTNIAEASVTIPRIKCVIDTGVVKERTWCTTTGAERLRVVECAQAAGWQRAGRAGRTQAGAAYRLYTAREFTLRPHHNTPEIVSTGSDDTSTHSGGNRTQYLSLDRRAASRLHKPQWLHQVAPDYARRCRANR